MSVLNVENKITKLYEIPITPEENQSFSTFIDEANFDIKIQTFADDKSTISIFKDGVCICAYAPITILNTNLLFYSEHKSGAFFLSSEDANLKNTTWENLGNEVKLYYGYF